MIFYLQSLIFQNKKYIVHCVVEGLVQGSFPFNPCRRFLFRMVSDQSDF